MRYKVRVDEGSNVKQTKLEYPGKRKTKNEMYSITSGMT